MSPCSDPSHKMALTPEVLGDTYRPHRDLQRGGKAGLCVLSHPAAPPAGQLGRLQVQTQSTISKPVAFPTSKLCSETTFILYCMGNKRICFAIRCVSVEPRTWHKIVTLPAVLDQ